MQFINTVESRFQDGADRHEILLDIFLRDLENFLFGFVQNLLDVFSFLEPQFQNFRGGADEPSEQGFFLHDLGVVHYVRGRGDGADDGSQIAGAANLLQKVFFLKFVGNGKHIQGLAVLIEFQNHLIDMVMGVLIEIPDFEKVGDFDDRVLVQHE